LFYLACPSKAVTNISKLFKEAQCLWEIKTKLLVPEGILILSWTIRGFKLCSRRRLIPELLILEELRNSVNPKSIYTGIQPKLENRNHFPYNNWIVVIRVRLFLCELMEVELGSALIPLPHRPTKDAHLEYYLGIWD
jgi:hypothetical protein